MSAFKPVRRFSVVGPDGSTRSEHRVEEGARQNCNKADRIVETTTITAALYEAVERVVVSRRAMQTYHTDVEWYGEFQAALGALATLWPKVAT